MRIAAAAFMLVLAAGAARGENLVSGLSQDQIQITSSYTGTELIVFGAIEPGDNDDASTMSTS